MAKTVVSDTTVTNPDGSTTETIVYSDGSKTTTLVPAPNSPAANQQTLQSRATAALAANVTYIGLAAPSTAQNTAQIKALTRQVDALIKLDLGLLDDTSGT